VDNPPNSQPPEQPQIDLSETLAAVPRDLPRAVIALGTAALLPGDFVPWPWLQEMTDIFHREVRWDSAAWQQIVSRVTADRLLIATDVPHVARMPAEVSAAVRSLVGPESSAKLMRALRPLVSRRLKEFKQLSKLLTDAVMRAANDGKDVTAWTVPKAEKVAMAASYNTYVGVVNNGDGSYNLLLREGALWEEACLQAFCASQLSSDSLDSIEWALRASYLRSNALTSQISRVHALCDANPTSQQAGLISGLLLLESAHGSAKFGAWHSAFSSAGSAVKKFTELHEKWPENAEFARLIEEARTYRDTYND
jgi:hypothetical protein